MEIIACQLCDELIGATVVEMSEHVSEFSYSCLLCKENDPRPGETSPP